MVTGDACRGDGEGNQLTRTRLIRQLQLAAIRVFLAVRPSQHLLKLSVT